MLKVVSVPPSGSSSLLQDQADEANNQTNSQKSKQILNNIYKKIWLKIAQVEEFRLLRVIIRSCQRGPRAALPAARWCYNT